MPNGALWCVPEARGLLWRNPGSCGSDTTTGEVVDHPGSVVTLGDDVQGGLQILSRLETLERGKTVICPY